MSAVSQKVFLEVKGENFRPQWRHNNLLSGRDGPQKVFFHGSFVGLDEMNKLLELEIVVKYLRKNIINFPFMLWEAGREMNQVKLEQKKQFPERNSNNLIKLNAGFGSRNVPSQL